MLKHHRNFLVPAVLAVAIAGCGSQAATTHSSTKASDPHQRPLEQFVAQGASQAHEFQAFKGVRSVDCHRTKRDGNGIDYRCLLTVRQGSGTTTVALQGAWAPGAGLFVDWEHGRVVS